MGVGDKIKNARIAKGLTQEQLGNIVGVQKSAIAKYENGRIINIKRSTLQKLAIALDLRGSDLIDEKPTVINDGLTENQRLLIEFAKTVPEEKAAKVLQVMKAILQSDL